MEMEKIRVLIAEDMEPILNRYARILSNTRDIKVVGKVMTGQEAVEFAQANDVDVVLMDIEMETRDAGLVATRKLLEKDSSLKIIILTVYEEDELIYSAFQYGAKDYLMKNAKADEIIRSIQDVYEEKVALRPMLADKILKEFKRARSHEESFQEAINLMGTLTDTEMEVLGLLLKKKTRKEICRLRYVEMSTVKTQIGHILKKLGKTTIKEVEGWIQEKQLGGFIQEQIKTNVKG